MRRTGTTSGIGTIGAVLIIAGVLAAGPVGVALMHGHGPAKNAVAAPTASVHPPSPSIAPSGRDVRVVRIRVVLHGSGYTSGGEVFWTAGSQRGTHHLSAADKSAPGTLDWSTSRYVRRGGKAKLTSTISGVKDEDKGEIKQECTISVMGTDGQYYPLPTKGSQLPTLCNVQATVP
jgi:hypothetical protein